MTRRVSFAVALLLAATIGPGPVAAQSEPAKQSGDRAADYDPLLVGSDSVEQLTLTVDDDARQRELPIRVYLPSAREPAAVVLFSHGLGGSRDNNPYLGNHWARRGYLVVFLQHPGSDEAVWRQPPPAERMAALRRAASAENFALRNGDVPRVIDQLGAWNQDSTHPLHQRLDLERLGMSGHSFGAVTTQAVSGQAFFGRTRFREPRIDAAVLMSPSAPSVGDPDRAFGHIEIPWLLMTGTHDTAVIGDADVESRLAVFPALPAGDKYELVLEGAEHSAFGERRLPGDRRGRNPNHHRAILALSTAFWDAYLLGDGAARAWLQGDGPRQILEEQDRWQQK